MFKYIYYCVNVEIFNILLPIHLLIIHLFVDIILLWIEFEMTVWYVLMLEYFEWKLQKLTQTSLSRKRKFMIRRLVVSEMKMKNKKTTDLIF